ncbi:GNAT family N-acetyltransferase [Planosporangium mesophilum]|nr:GNAT family N-acetyltransferase [Planosporangium mesophilum]NJC86101.1 GNAT family N-acetyltransferase [Planosporangium mesophilum]
MRVEIETIREVTDEVVAAFARLLPQLSSSADPPDRASLGRVVAAEPNTVLVARSAGRIVGTLTLVTVPMLTGVRCRIEDVVVDSSARGQGVGAELTTAALRLAREAGAGSVELTSRASRIAANRLYQRLGFQRRESNLYRYPLSGPAELP